jgi:hypothetical protein
MTAKIVIRLLTADNQLLGWCEHHARMRGDGGLRSDSVVRLAPTLAGTPVCVSMHWCDVNTEVRIPWTAGPVTVGSIVTLFAPDEMMIRVGEMTGRLPPVTVGSTSIGMPAASLGLKDQF